MRSKWCGALVATYVLPCGKCGGSNAVEATPGAEVEWLCVHCDNMTLDEVIVMVDDEETTEIMEVVRPNVSSIGTS